MKRIYPLPPSLTNQIAAGEVIERPASVVKELLENALDAKAHHITITIEAGGVQCIEISDDGQGIHPDDLPLAVMSHATSKISTIDDLFSVQSLGFRGEALASISSVSRFSIISKTAESEQGIELTFDEINKTINLSPKARSNGTTISVRDLFYNTPVRRKFLSSEKTEWLQIEQVVKRIALSRFDVAFQLKNKTTLYLPAVDSDAGIEARVKKIFGGSFLEQSIKLDAEYNHELRLWGWIGKAELMRSQNDLQYFYLNGRMIRDKLINHAIRSAYEGHLYPGRQPVFLLYLEMPPEWVDVNVHPTKHEVRFREPRQVHDFIQSVIQGKLVRASMTQSSPILQNTAISVGEGLVPARWRATTRVAPTEIERTDMPDGLSPNTYESVKNNKKIQENAAHYQYNLPIQSKMPSMARTTESLKTLLNPNHHVNLQWLEYPYALITFNQKKLLCNYIHLYQSLCRQHFLEDLAENKVISRPLLVPIRLNISPALLENLMADTQRLEKFGFSMNAMDEKTLCIRAFPARLPYLDFQQWINYLTEQKYSNISNMTDLLFMNSLIQCNLPVFPVSSNDLEGVLADFNYYQTHENVSQSYRVITLANWEEWLKKGG